MKQPFFIIGSGRSGSTYLFSILRRHPQVAITNEAKIIDAISFAAEYLTLPSGEVNESRGVEGVVNEEVIPFVYEIFARHMRMLLEEFYAEYFDHEFTHWGDKLPDACSALNTRKLFPHTKFVVPLRDPRDVACSYLRHNERSTAPVVANGVPTVEEQARSWRDTYEFIENRMDEFHLIRYEELIRAPQTSVEALLEFLGLPMVPEIHEAIAGNETFGLHATSPSPEASIGRWRELMGPDQLATVEEICGPLMDHFGFARSKKIG